eukprot:5467076-Pleurochrysis_carterae.AAC.1
MRKLEALLLPYAPRLSAADMAEKLTPARVAYILAAAERVRAAAATTQQREAGPKGGSDEPEDGADGVAKGVVPAAYRKNLNAELQGAAYCAVRERLLRRHREGGADVDVNLLEIPITGEPPEWCRAALCYAPGSLHVPPVRADGHGRCQSPLLHQLAWGTLHVDAVDPNIDFFAGVADQQSSYFLKK